MSLNGNGMYIEGRSPSRAAPRRLVNKLTREIHRMSNHFGVVGCQNQIKMAELCPLKVAAKVASWPIIG